MDLCNLGKHCEFSECGRLDFLPFKCDKCNKYYCLQHKDYDKHLCSKHNDNSRINIVNKPRKKTTTFRCSCCRVKQIIEIKCLKCGLNYCPKHITPEVHNCCKLK